MAFSASFWWGHAPPSSQLVRAMASFEVPAGVVNVSPQDAADALQPLLAESWQALPRP